MKNIINFILLSGALICLSVTDSIAEESFFVQPFQARIFAKPSLSSEVLGTVDSGFQFVSTGLEGRWVLLKYKGKQGYIPAVQTAKTQPLGKSIVQGIETSPKLGARARTSSSSAVVAGMKGLTYEDRSRVTKGERSDFDSLDRIDAYQISPDELKKFQLEGGLR